MNSPNQIDPSPLNRGRVNPVLQQRLSDALDLEARLKQAHWNIRGPTFLQLHGLFDSAHAAVEEFTDLIAERIVALGSVADGRIQTTAEKSSLSVYPFGAQAETDTLLEMVGAHLRS